VAAKIDERKGTFARAAREDDALCSCCGSHYASAWIESEVRE